MTIMTHTNLTKEIQSLSEMIEFDKCSVCRQVDVFRLPIDWKKQVEEGKAIPIVACGNPWHYVFLEDK